MIFYCFTTVENLIPETIFPDTIPNVLHWVEAQGCKAGGRSAPCGLASRK